jgi:hypothetical protein
MVLTSSISSQVSRIHRRRQLMMKISLHGTVGADLRKVRGGTTRWSPLAVLLAVIPASGVLINDSGGHENNASEAINVL